MRCIFYVCIPGEVYIPNRIMEVQKSQHLRSEEIRFFREEGLPWESLKIMALGFLPSIVHVSFWWGIQLIPSLIRFLRFKPPRSCDVKRCCSFNRETPDFQGKVRVGETTLRSENNNNTNNKNITTFWMEDGLRKTPSGFWGCRFFRDEWSEGVPVWRSEFLRWRWGTVPPTKWPAGFGWSMCSWIPPVQWASRVIGHLDFLEVPWHPAKPNNAQRLGPKTSGDFCLAVCLSRTYI